MAEKKSNRLVLFSTLAVLGLAGTVFVPISMSRTSTMDYCTSCHEMKGHGNELKKSSHAVDKDKKPIECAQCHIPNSIGPKYLTIKTVLGMKDLLFHYVGDPDRLDRRRMQNVARRFVPDENCRSCHEDLSKTAKGQKISDIGKLCHDAYLGINGTTKRNCAGCHFNMAHLPEFDRRFFFNAEFMKKLELEITKEKI